MPRVVPFAIAVVVVLATMVCAQEPDESTDSTEAAPAPAEARPGPADTVPVTWETQSRHLGAMLARQVTAGERLAIVCPTKGGTGTSVWGTDVYTDDSSICMAAVHAGLISIRDGGTVVVEILPGQPEYQGTERHGVTTANYGQWTGSFAFVGSDEDEED